MVCAPGGRDSNPINLSSGKQVGVRGHPGLLVCFGCPTAFAPVPTEAGAALWQCMVRSSPWPLFCVMFCARMPCRYTYGHSSVPHTFTCFSAGVTLRSPCCFCVRCFAPSAGTRTVTHPTWRAAASSPAGRPTSTLLAAHATPPEGEVERGGVGPAGGGGHV
jgi:hypothetical protein